VKLVEKEDLEAIQVGKECFWVVLCLIDKSIVASYYFVFIGSGLVDFKVFFIV